MQSAPYLFFDLRGGFDTTAPLGIFVPGPKTEGSGGGRNFDGTVRRINCSIWKRSLIVSRRAENGTSCTVEKRVNIAA
jgi:hypothetical protein